MANRTQDNKTVINMTKWRKIGTYFDMSVEENGKKRRLVDFSGKVLKEFNV